MDLRHRPHQSHRRRKISSTGEDRTSSLGAQDVPQHENPDVVELRRVRAEFYRKPPEQRRKESSNTMAGLETPRRSSSTRTPPKRMPEVIIRDIPARPPSERHRHRRKTREEVGNADDQHVYVYHSQSPVKKPPPLRRSKTTIVTSSTRPKETRRSSDLPGNLTERRESHPIKERIIRRRSRKDSHSLDGPSKSHRDEPPMTRYIGKVDLFVLLTDPRSRSASMRETSSVPRRPSLHRSQTTTRRVHSASLSSPTTLVTRHRRKSPPPVTKDSRRSSGFFGSILGFPKAPATPEKQYVLYFYALQTRTTLYSSPRANHVRTESNASPA